MSPVPSFRIKFWETKFPSTSQPTFRWPFISPPITSTPVTTQEKVCGVSIGADPPSVQKPAPLALQPEASKPPSCTFQPTPGAVTRAGRSATPPSCHAIDSRTNPAGVTPLILGVAVTENIPSPFSSSRAPSSYPTNSEQLGHNGPGFNDPEYRILAAGTVPAKIIASATMAKTETSVFFILTFVPTATYATDGFYFSNNKAKQSFQATVRLVYLILSNIFNIMSNFFSKKLANSTKTKQAKTA